MHGSWVLVRMKGRGGDKPKSAWLLIKHRDDGAVEGNGTGPTDADRSVASGRTMAEITAGSGRPAKPFMTAEDAAAGARWQSNREEKGTGTDDATSVGVTPKKTPKATTVSRLPDFVEPQLAQSLAKPPSGSGWAHEIKFDGYRMQLRVRRRQGVACSPASGLDWSSQVPRDRGVRRGTGLGRASSTARWWRWTTHGAPDFAGLQAGDLRGQDGRPGLLRVRPPVRREGRSASSAALRAQGSAAGPGQGCAGQHPLCRALRRRPATPSC